MMAPSNSHSSLVFGASGALGIEIVKTLIEMGAQVTAVVRSETAEDLPCEVFLLEHADRKNMRDVPGGPFGSVIWAQGTNLNDDVEDCQIENFQGLMDANLLFILETLKSLLKSDQIVDGSRLCVVSSIWQELARQDKFSYTISKAALGGLVRAVSADLATRQILINAVLPGVVDTPMTRGVLTIEQIEKIADSTGFGRLITTRDVAEAVVFLCSPNNKAITGQSLVVDLGFSHVRNI